MKLGTPPALWFVAPAVFLAVTSCADKKRQPKIQPEASAQRTLTSTQASPRKPGKPECVREECGYRFSATEGAIEVWLVVEPPAETRGKCLISGRGPDNAKASTEIDCTTDKFGKFFARPHITGFSSVTRVSWSRAGGTSKINRDVGGGPTPTYPCSLCKLEVDSNKTGALRFVGDFNKKPANGKYPLEHVTIHFNYFVRVDGALKEVSAEREMFSEIKQPAADKQRYTSSFTIGEFEKLGTKRCLSYDHAGETKFDHCSDFTSDRDGEQSLPQP